MAKLSSKHASKTKRALVYGPPKVGKTEWVGKLAEKFNLIWFDCENGHDTLFKLPKEWQERIELIVLPDSRSFPIAIETMLKVIKGGPVSICEEHGKVSCPRCTDIKTRKAKEGCAVVDVELNKLSNDTIVVVDSLTQITNSAISHITKGKPDDYKPNWDDWGHLGKLMDMFLSHVQVAPYNIVCISHESAVEMQDGKEKIVPTAGTRNFSRNSAKYFGEVLYCEVVNKQHKIASSTTYRNNILTGSRAGKELEADKEAKLVDLFL